MAWVMTSLRTKGSYGNPPSVLFAIGGLVIAEIVMKSDSSGWHFDLEYSDVNHTIVETFESFSCALTRLHELLNGPGPVGFEVFKSKGKTHD